MKTITTKEELMRIRQIKNITSIEYKDIYLPNSNGNKQLVPGLIITYGDTNTLMFLTSSDPFFDEYVRKVREVYLEEKDHVIREGIKGKEYIQINPTTKEILLHGDLENTTSRIQKYAATSSYKESLLMEEDRLKAIFPMMEYHLKELLKRFDRNISQIKCSEGINGVYYLTAKIQNTPITIPVYYEEQEDSFKITFASLLEDAIPIQMEGMFTKSGINIHTYIEEYNYSDYTTYQVQNNKMVKEREIHFEGRLRHYEKQDLPVTSKDEAESIYKIEGESNGITWYQLPWNAFIGLREDKWYMKEDGTRSKQEENERMVENKIIYLGKNQDSFYMKEIASKRYHRKLDDRTEGGNLLLDYQNMRKIGLLSKDSCIIETHFIDRGVSGKYQEALSGNYFYEIYDTNLNQGRFINQKDGLEEKSDLFEPKKYIKKEEA